MIYLIDFRLYSVIIWAPNIDNNEEKILGKIKEINSKAILVSIDMLPMHKCKGF